MKCPHCLQNYHSQPKTTPLLRSDSEGLSDLTGPWEANCDKCPACSEVSIALTRRVASNKHVDKSWMVHPVTTGRPNLPPEVPDEFSADYLEACKVLTLSPKASAALSRRCLQHIIRGHLNIKKRDLNLEIDELLPKLPTELQKMVDAIRVVGNWAAHPMKAEHSGEIIEVEPEEAEWSLDTLEMLYDFFFVRPAHTEAMRAMINKKLDSLGSKYPLK